MKKDGDGMVFCDSGMVFCDSCIGSDQGLALQDGASNLEAQGGRLEHHTDRQREITDDRLV